FFEDQKGSAEGALGANLRALPLRDRLTSGGLRERDSRLGRGEFEIRGMGREEQGRGGMGGVGTHEDGRWTPRLKATLSVGRHFSGLKAAAPSVRVRAIIRQIVRLGL